MDQAGRSGSKRPRSTKRASDKTVPTTSSRKTWTGRVGGCESDMQGIVDPNPNPKLPSVDTHCPVGHPGSFLMEQSCTPWWPRILSLGGPEAPDSATQRGGRNGLERPLGSGREPSRSGDPGRAAYDP